MNNMIPKRVFLTKGAGVHKDKLGSFELALRNAGIEKCNLVNVSSILPPNCKIISRDEGLKLLEPGQITFCVMAKNETNEPNRLISSAVGVAMPNDTKDYGYLSEHSSSGEAAKKADDYAEYLAASMLATTLGKAGSDNIFETRHAHQSAEGNKNGLWTTVIAAAVFIME